MVAVQATTAYAWVHFGNANLTAKDGSTVVASGTAGDMRVGWYQLAGRNYSSANYSFTDRAPGNGRNAYAEVLAYHEYVYWLPMPGGGSTPKIGTSYAASGFSSRVSSSWSGTVSSTWAPAAYIGVGAIFRICEDAPLWPDNCGAVNKYVSAQNYS